jgi:NAD(P)-dependent dehydrogenase (short-subunit alcohol dehydrogenase family)
VLITGGSRGLGLVLARQLAREGAHVAICARDPEELERATDELETLGPTAMPIMADVTDAERMKEAVEMIADERGPVDVVVNNASTICVGPLATMTRQDFEEALAITFWGAYNTIEAVLPSMRARQQGRIVNIASIGGKVGVPHLVPYCVGKFALVGYSEGLRAELARDGIMVTTICPGLMRTGSPRNAKFKGSREAEYAWFKLSDSLPFVSVSAENAAAEIIHACRRGDAQHIVSLPAQFSITLNTLFPEWTANLTCLVNELLPKAHAADHAAQPGKDLELPSALARFTALTDHAAAQNNEVDPHEDASDALGTERS